MEDGEGDMFGKDAEDEGDVEGAGENGFMGVLVEEEGLLLLPVSSSLTSHTNLQFSR